MADLNGIQLRYELKHFITEGEYVVLRDRLMAAMPLDNNALGDTRNYAIRSLYFDDIFNSAMWEKQNGLMIRKKYRIRIYNLRDDNIHLEKKMKFDQMTAKDSYKLTREECEHLLHNQWQLLPLGKHIILDEVLADMRTKLLKPVVMVDYHREAYTYHAGNVRVTFDRHVCSGQFSTDLFSGHPATGPILPPGTMILEVKYDNYLPPHIRGILGSVRASRSAISKYALCRRFH